MSPERTCPDCGRTLPADAPRGLCPECLMGAALSRRLSDGSATSGGAAPAGAGILDTIAHGIGPITRVLLCDTAPGEEPGPIVRKPDAEDADTSIRYRIDGEIARGGMGAVLKGRDPDLGRDVALKVLREDLRDNADMVRRFVEEAQIGGQLQHPGVVPIYELGTFADRRPFFAMKLVKGHTLAQLLEDRKDRADDLPRFLSIFEAVCQTMAYAHARGVIHRDLKPSNVMVGSFGEVQVMDWGLAKVLPRGGVIDDALAGKAEHQETVIATARSGSDAPGLSGAGSIMGTPSYMAPEQARGEIDLIDDRADVFALGSILAKILTGEPAFIGRTSGEIQRTAALGDTADALARLEACAADSALIALAKDCLAREREDRPRDASAVAKRITAYLASVQERLRRAELATVEERARRRMTTVVAASVLALTAVGGGGWVLIKADRDARVAALTREVNDSLNKATSLRAQASSATTGGALLFAQAREQAQRALALVENGPADAALVAQVARVQADLDEEEKDRQLVTALDEARLAQAEAVPGENRFAKERAMPLFREAFRAFGLPPGESEPKVAAERIRQRPAAVREAILAALDEWDSLASDKKYALTEPHQEWLRGVLEEAEPADGWTRRLRAARDEKDEARRRGALEKLAADDEVGTRHVRALSRLAAQLEDVKAAKAAAQLLRRAQQQHPADFWVNEYLGRALSKLRPPEWDDSLRFLTAAAALRPENAIAHCNVGVALSGKGQLDAAIVCYKKAIELDPLSASAHHYLGIALHGKGQLEAAIAYYKKAIELNPKYAPAHSSQGTAMSEGGELDAAIACFEKAIELDPKYAAARRGLGATLVHKGQLEAAIACFRKAIELDPNDSRAHNDLGIAFKNNGQTNAAIASYKTAIELDPKNAIAHLNLGVTFKAKGQLDTAIEYYKKAIESDPKLAMAQNNLGNALRDKGQFDAAIECFRKAIELDPKFAMAQNNLGNVWKEKGQFDAAIACYKKAIELNPKYGLARNGLARAQRLAAVQEKLPALLSGEFKPATSEERLALAELCLIKKLYRTSAGLCADVFVADPKLADDLQAGLRYAAACHAALAAAGGGQDAANLDETEKSRLRKQALDWLCADLALWTKLNDSGQPAARARIQPTLTHWQQDSDLAGIRDAAALAKLPEAERLSWQALWADVEALRAKAQAP